jgi:hypothetical protein
MEEARPKLDLSGVNLADLTLALEDHSEDRTWRTGSTWGECTCRVAAA